MITLGFKNGLTENAFSFANEFVYRSADYVPFGLFFSKESNNYPFILKGGESNTFELQYSSYNYQLRDRLLNTKKIKEVMDSAKIPLVFRIKTRNYLIGKGFLSTYDFDGNHTLLFIACVDGTKNTTSIEQVKFFVSKEIYTDAHKALQPAIKDLVGGHPGDVTVCTNILDYVGEKITLPRGGNLSSLKKYKEAVVRTTLTEVLKRDEGSVPIEAPFVIAGFVEGSVVQHRDPSPW